MHPILVASGFAFLSLAAAGLSQPASDNQAKAMSVVERTKTTDATYAVYTRDFVSIAGKEPYEAWGAEFHSGDQHRVDNMVARVVANCRNRTGVMVILATGERTEGAKVANAACGINSNFPLQGAAWIGEIETPFGKAERIRMTDEHNIRTYDILSNGALLRAVYAENTPSQHIQVRQETLAVSNRLPDGDIFSAESLSNSVVADRYKLGSKPQSR